MKRLTRSAAFYVILGLLVLALATSMLGGGSGRKTITLSQFEKYVAAERVKSASVIDGADEVKGELTNGQKYVAKYPALYADELTAELHKAGISYDAKPKKDNVWLSRKKKNRMIST